MSREDRGKLSQDCSDPQSLCYRPMCPRGEQVNHGGRAGEGWRLAASTVPQGLFLGGTPIYLDDPRRKDEGGKFRVASKDATPVFLDFPVFLVPRLSPLMGLDVLIVLRQRGTKNTGYAWLSP